MTPEYYDVRQIDSGMAVYCGRSLAKAADALVPGTCYGKGPKPMAAYREVRKELRRHSPQLGKGKGE